MLTCVMCSKEFVRLGKHGPIPKYCSPRCSAKRKRSTPGRKLYERLYRRAERASGKRVTYEYHYNRRPEVRARGLRRYYQFYRDPFMDMEIPVPYSGHMWMDKIRAMAGPAPEQTAPWADMYNDTVGEGVLAFLEGRDPKEAMDAFRKHEYIPTYRTIHFGQMMDNADGNNWERFFPVPSMYDRPPAYEEEAPPESAESIPVGTEMKTRFKMHHSGPPMRAMSRKGSKGPNRSFKKFRGRRNK